jgi:hypothetical protein
MSRQARGAGSVGPGRQGAALGMIVSASYRTDIAALYAPWFLRRLAAGSAFVANPYSGAPLEVSLRPGEVEGFVFWTRNLKPLFPHLERVAQVAPFSVQFTITGYPRALERAVIDAEAAVAQIDHLARRWGRRVAVWRYDPVLVSTLTPPEWHIANFRRLAVALSGAVDEVVLSFVQPYRKTARNLDRAAASCGFYWRDPAVEEKRALLGNLAALAAATGIRASLCSQPELLLPGLGEARCIDSERLSAMAGRGIEAPESGNRPGCRCARSRDIGAYDSCVQGCAYCYAVTSRERARLKRRVHRPEGAFLLTPGGR